MTAVRGLRAQAPAKINRELRVGPRRPDGFHDIRSRFASIALADEIEAEEAQGFSFSCDQSGVPGNETNLVVRAARALAAGTRGSSRASGCAFPSASPWEPVWAAAAPTPP